MRQTDLEDIKKIYEQNGGRLDAERLERCARTASRCAADVSASLLGCAETPHIQFLAAEKTAQVAGEIRSRQGDGEVDSRRRAEWRSAAKGVKKVHAALVNHGLACAAQCKKISTMCARELRRGLSKTSKTNPVLKSKKIYRELSGHIRRTERDMKDRTKRAEKAETERRRREQEEKEEQRQKRKFEYLLTQTELFSHFILNKNKGLDDDEHSKGYEAAALERERIREFETAQAKRRKTKGEKQGVAQPSILTCELKEYQLKGLSWLVGLYDKGINGILADDMGLGKTLQSISLLAYLYETEEIPGPFLVVTPASTLHNWSQEFSKFLPSFQVCCFWGSTAERRELKRQFKSSNVVVTSYQTAVTDERVLKKVRWQYIVLDEAQAIKSSSSQRWKTLLGLRARNKLLLTGTPVQNSMQELWALLHFIMPTLFDSLTEFSDWFSKEIESSATLRKAVDEKSLQRLHAILKPFMLRRHKSDVIHELSQKTQIDLYCDLSYRQKMLYEEITQSCSSMEMENLVMQLKKVCNHPELFEKLEPTCGLSLELSDGLGDVVCFGRSKMKIEIPRLVAQDAADRFARMEEDVVRWAAMLRRTVNEGCWARESLDFRHAGHVIRSVEEAGRMILKNRTDGHGLAGDVGRRVRGELDALQSLVHCTDRVVATMPRVVCWMRFPERRMESVYRSLDRTIHVPPLNTFISDSGKLGLLDQLLPRLKAEGHRLLIYFQMTRMIDLMEDYLVKKGYTYLRLDGSSKISNRRDMVRDWQTNDKFIFLLSTRAGGLGINLTAADTVVFYDSDWNPTVDQQAMDRAHRLGQTRDVTVYRLITRGTVEERVLESASRKDEIQKMVIHGNVFEHL